MRWISALGGAIVTAAGVAVLASAMSTPAPSGAALSQAAPLAPPPPLVVAESTTTTTVSVTPAVEGLDPSVADALSTLGYTDFAAEGDLLAQLPPSVVSALIEEGAVLVVEAPPVAP